ncbi:hypothetical protein NHP190003_16330 (plasmid) [Helicobacter sp. NHP19-003]|uniref:Uncharacterized protein n=2 Tax=Helicobacter gastrocanis TaxID=2849641 RepID=A0ABN6I487_9HELI|nr:hypothetical protein NHP190003_16330 [Helicobacter sp. NHP19-003]
MLCKIGDNKVEGWEQSKCGCVVVLWLPWLAFVDHSNCSIAAAILNATKTPLKPTAVYDVSSALNSIYTD